MRNDVSRCTVFSCLGLSVWGGHVLCEGQGGDLGVGHVPACCHGFSTCHLTFMVLPTVVRSSLEGRVLWYFLYSAREGGRMIAI